MQALKLSISLKASGRHLRQRNMGQQSNSCNLRQQLKHFTSQSRKRDAFRANWANDLCNSRRSCCCCLLNCCCCCRLCCLCCCCCIPFCSVVLGYLHTATANEMQLKYLHCIFVCLFVLYTSSCEGVWCVCVCVCVCFKV